MNDPSCCPTCGATTVEYSFWLNLGLVTALGKLARAGGRAKRSELKLTNSEYTNFVKLSYWGLAIQPADEQGKVRGRPWEITYRGRLFLGGHIVMLKSAVTYRGKVRRLEGKMVRVTDVDPDWKTAEWYVETRVSAGPPGPEPVQHELAGMGV